MKKPLQITKVEKPKSVEKPKLQVEKPKSVEKPKLQLRNLNL